MCKATLTEDTGIEIKTGTILVMGLKDGPV